MVAQTVMAVLLVAAPEMGTPETPVVQALLAMLALPVLALMLVVLVHPETLALTEIRAILVQEAMGPRLVAQALRVMLVLMVTQVPRVMRVQAQLLVTPAVQGAQALMAIRAIPVMQVLVQMPVPQVLRVTQVLMVMLVQQAQRALVLLRVVQVLRVMLARLVMQGPRATQELALHRAMQDRLMLGVPETPDQRPQLTAQTPQKFGHSSRFRSQLVVGARQGKSPLLGDGPR